LPRILVGDIDADLLIVSSTVPRGRTLDPSVHELTRRVQRHDGCQVMRYDTRYGALGTLLDRVMIRRKTDEGIKGFLAGLNTIVTNAHRSTTT
jgi:hypothetical protein